MIKYGNSENNSNIVIAVFLQLQYKHLVGISSISTEEKWNFCNVFVCAVYLLCIFVLSVERTFIAIDSVDKVMVQFTMSFLGLIKIILLLVRRLKNVC